MPVESRPSEDAAKIKEEVVGNPNKFDQEVIPPDVEWVAADLKPELSLSNKLSSSEQQSIIA